MRNPLPRQNLFWNSPIGTAFWPRDPADHIFLGRLVHRAGLALFPNEWTERDPEVCSPRVLVGEDIERRHDFSDDGLVERAQAALLLGWFGRDDGSDMLPDDHDGVDVLERLRDQPEIEADILSFSADEWVRAAELSLEHNRLCHARWKRFLRVQEAVVVAAEQGRLRCSYRKRGGGPLVEIPPVWWGIGAAQQAARFEHCSIDPGDPFAATAPALEEGYEIFLAVAEIGGFLTSLGQDDHMRDAAPTVSPSVRAFECSSPPNAFWSRGSRERWASNDDDNKRVFLARALLELGRAVNGGDWVDEAPGWISWTPDPTPRASDSGNEVERILAEQNAVRQRVRSEAKRQGQDVLERLLSAGRSKIIEISHFSYLEQTHTPCLAGWWLPDKSWAHLLDRCDIRPDRPASLARRRDMQGLYVDRIGLDRLIRTIYGEPDLDPGSTPPAETSRMKGKGGRPDTGPTTLFLYRERLLKNETLKIKKHEATAILKSWCGSIPQPGVETVEDTLTPFHSRLIFDQRRKGASQTTMEDVRKLLDDELKDFAP